jgi:hypothetical protein
MGNGLILSRIDISDTDISATISRMIDILFNICY